MCAGLVRVWCVCLCVCICVSVCLCAGVYESVCVWVIVADGCIILIMLDDDAC